MLLDQSTRTLNNLLLFSLPGTGADTQEENVILCWKISEMEADRAGQYSWEIWGPRNILRLGNTKL
jgi:hypothetical protein